MDKETARFSATQTENGFQIEYFDSADELIVSVEDLNDFANKYAKELFQGKLSSLNDKEKLMFSLWEMVLIPDDIKQ